MPKFQDSDKSFTRAEIKQLQFLQKKNNQSAVYAVVLSTHDTYTMKLFDEGLSNKCLFGLPIFTMQWWDDFNKAFVYFITRDAYLKFDTPQGRLEKDLFGF